MLNKVYIENMLNKVIIENMLNKVYLSLFDKQKSTIKNITFKIKSSQFSEKPSLK